MSEDRISELRSAAGCLGLLILLAILLALVGCASCEPQVIEKPVEVKVPYPQIVVPDLPAKPACEAHEVCPAVMPDAGQCAARNVTKMETCIQLWNDWWDQVDDVMGGLVP